MIAVAHVDHPNEGPGVDYNRPTRYDGPDVASQAPLVNPSAGTQGDTGGGVNPRGPAVNPVEPTGSHGNAPFPDTTAADPPSKGPARPGPR